MKIVLSGQLSDGYCLLLGIQKTKRLFEKSLFRLEHFPAALCLHNRHYHLMCHIFGEYYSPPHSKPTKRQDAPPMVIGQQ